uniref:C2 domain-containing protein n=1 Tax=Timema poppense TaxID=170557 RepID=A0A7R9DI99_TIMPO|nr:unnamed protein product [Timema poppensis]
MKLEVGRVSDTPPLGGANKQRDVSAFRLIAGRCDAFCEVSMGSQEHRTLAVQATSEARWNATMQFLVKDLKEDVLCITVFDRGHFSPNDCADTLLTPKSRLLSVAEFLGRTEVRVADILRETRNDHGPVNTRLQLHEVESGEISLKLDLRLFNREL